MFLDDDGLHSLMGLDEPMEQFMYRFVNSFIKWELVNYFHEHPHTPYKISELSKALNRPADQIKNELQELSAEGMLREIKNGKKFEYNYDLSPDNAKERRLHDLVNQFVHLCRTREGRLRVIYKILKNGKSISS
jgi:predicted transcriptional regulator